MNIHVPIVVLWVLIISSSAVVHSDYGGLYDIDSLRTPGSLHPLAGKMPSARVFNSLTKVGNYVISYGGYNLDGRPLDDVNLYDVRSQRWSGPIWRRECCNLAGQTVEKIGSDQHIQDPYQRIGFEGDAPLARGEHGATAIGGQLYVFGGNTSSHFGLRQDFYSFDPTLLQWKVLDNATGGVPSKRAGHSMISSSTSLFVFGGRSRRGSIVFGNNDIWRYSPASNLWERLTGTTTRRTGSVSSDGTSSYSNTGPAGRQHAATAFFEEKLLIYGGIDPASDATFNDLWVFHIGFRTWEQLTAQTGRGLHLSHPPLYRASLTYFDSVEVLRNADSDANYYFTESTRLLLYGGLGGGGSCGGRRCGQKESVLGQVYQLNVRWANFTSTRIRQVSTRLETVVIGEESRFTSPSTVEWAFSRLTDASSQRGRRGKAYALESVVFDPERKLMYEFGGLQENATAVPITLSEAVAPTVTRDTGGSFQNVLWDLATGEHLRNALTIPVNAPWLYLDALATAQPEAHAFSIQFLRQFRVFSVGSNDMILIQESTEKEALS